MGKVERGCVWGGDLSHVCWNTHSGYVIEGSAGIWMVFQGLSVKLPPCAIQAGDPPFPHDLHDPGTPPRPPPLTLSTRMESRDSEVGNTGQRKILTEKGDIIHSRACYFSSEVLKHILYSDSQALPPLPQYTSAGCCRLTCAATSSNSFPSSEALHQIGWPDYCINFELMLVLKLNKDEIRPRGSKWRLCTTVADDYTPKTRKCHFKKRRASFPSWSFLSRTGELG